MTESPFPLAMDPLKDEIPARMLVLASVAEPPRDYDGDLFGHYPGMKLGRMSDVDFFAGKLCDLAAQVLAEGTADDEWVLTAPAYYRLPAGANLLAERMHSMLCDRGVALSLVALRQSFEQIAVHSLEEFRLSHDYSLSPLAQRVIERQRLHDMAPSDPSRRRFAKRKVIVVNDIHVTGTQQRFMQLELAAAGASECHWLYIFHIEDELARACPEIEHRINNSDLADLDSYAALLSDPATRHTARCLARLFNTEPDQFRYLVATLQPNARERIYRLARDEERYDIPLFAEKMRLLAGSD
ncbi:hypothetical protein [Dyella choica]|uniref:Uncharacterized protein n=1 Tax=Dyella choica TaxID=1927959 RepID=A0A3S0Q5R6_9GAMM|nr:hypothetical protein [Dyella choica]RUL77650.1 hypothetical protein EKH80_07180 [Dyella choica]